MFTINIPNTVKTILEKLNENYDDYVVGGCVRDAVLGKEPKDWDITTNALPEQIKKVFEGYPIINNNGEKHGTITVHIGDENYEITTYRIDGDYSDGRHPDKVTFTANLKDDLARRDFTINAMAADINGELIDPFDGRKDLLHGILRCVGDPNKRFDEDALRILRGLRFASVLNLVIDRDTLDAMFRARYNLYKISKERIFTEIKKMVMRSLYTIFTKSEMCDVLNMSSAKYDQLMKDCGLSQTNGIDSENGLGDDEINTALTANTIVALTDKCPEAIADEYIDAANAIYFNTLNNAARIYASALNGFDNSNEEKAIDWDKIYNVDMFAEIKGNARTRKIA